MIVLLEKTVKARNRLYVFFYLVVILFFIVSTIQLNNVIIMYKYKKLYPELNIQPIINESLNTVLIRYDENNVSTVDKWINLVDNFLETYRSHSLIIQDLAASCDFKHPPKRGQVCPVDLDNFGPCIPPFYGYYSFSPCVFLKLSQIKGWIPQYYNTTHRLPPSMPKDLVAEIAQASIKNESNQVWISCQGVNDIDKESIETFNYYPGRGFPFYYFPLAHRDQDFLGPVMAVEIVNIKPGYFINIECRMWSKYLPYKQIRSNQRIGTVRFGIMRDELQYYTI